MSTNLESAITKVIGSMEPNIFTQVSVTFGRDHMGIWYASVEYENSDMDGAYHYNQGESNEGEQLIRMANAMLARLPLPRGIAEVAS